ncbi:Predicted membrane protein [Plasmopara halstedii]|uniref:Predicted membrane protein n=1 Tax=Plasmopara halstedii TaxID=4781 RepID=A0A0P1AUK7_PLAHL|nr:Predicted membrane protein [Plasmopara halstedii]CEG45381.1 Predicted membrane protein [Plasmopara halstedii]|eukprot:XP_024581750.1 Predicted membrane protein [Plasmopara halstedii]
MMLRGEMSDRTSQDSTESEHLMKKNSESSSSQHQCEKVAETNLEQIPKELEPQTTQSWRQRAKTFAIEYGRVGVCTHVVLSLLSFSFIYVGVSSGLNVSAILESLGLSTLASETATKSTGSFLITYTLFKLLAPIRWPLTCTVTPVVLRSLRRKGFMLAATNSPSNRVSETPQ